MEVRPGKGVLKRDKFPNTGNTVSGGSVVSLGISEGKITRRKNK